MNNRIVIVCTVVLALLFVSLPLMSPAQSGKIET